MLSFRPEMDSIPNRFPKFLVFYCRRHKRDISTLVFLILLWAATVSLTPYALKALIDSLNTSSVVKQSPSLDVQISAIFFVFILIATNIILRLYDWVMLKIFPLLKNEIASDLFKHLASHPYLFFQQKFSGSLSNVINDLAKGTASIIHILIDQFVARLFAVVIGAISMAFVHPIFALGLVLWFLFFIFVSSNLAIKAQKYSLEFSLARSQVIGQIADSISNVFNIKIFAREDHEYSLLQNSSQKSLFSERKINKFIMKSKIVYNSSILILLIYILSIAIHKKLTNNITIGDCAFLLTLTLALTRDILLIINQLTNISEEIGNCQHAIDTLQFEKHCRSSKNAKSLQVSCGEVRFENIHFGYDSKPVLFHNLSLTIKGGSKVGFIGLSGSGKTTFAHIVLRLYVPSAGKIFIDDQDISEVSEKSLRDQIAFIPQEPFLFHRSIMENIRYGRPDATDVEVFECAIKANCHEFISELTHGYQTIVGARGNTLSGGQKQRIAIGRAILKNAPIFILDEATSALDPITEHSIQKNLFSFIQNKTTIIITHRLSTLLQMDRIIMLEGGCIVGDGSHEELIRGNENYINLWNKNREKQKI